MIWTLIYRIINKNNNNLKISWGEMVVIKDIEGLEVVLFNRVVEIIILTILVQKQMLNKSINKKSIIYKYPLLKMVNR